MRGLVAATATGEKGDFLDGGRAVDNCVYCVSAGNCGRDAEGGLLSDSEMTSPGWQAATPHSEAMMSALASEEMKCFSVKDALASFLPQL